MRTADEVEVEIWMPIEGFNGLYEVSNLGQVRSIRRWRCLGRVLRPSKSTYGYGQVSLYCNGVAHKRLVHRLVAEAFIGPLPTGMETLHGLGGKNDNRAENLSYGTSQQNSDDELRDGTRVRGEQRWNARLTEADVRECRARHAAGESQSALAREFRMSLTGMHNVIHGHRWGWVK